MKLTELFLAELEREAPRDIARPPSELSGRSSVAEMSPAAAVWPTTSSRVRGSDRQNGACPAMITRSAGSKP